MQYMIWLVPASYLMAAIWAGGVKNSKFFWGLPAFHLLLWAALAVSNGTWLQCEGDLWGAQAVSCAFVALLLARGRSALLVVPFVLLVPFFTRRQRTIIPSRVLQNSHLFRLRKR